MAERNYPIPDEPEYDPNIRALQNSDEANADTVFNPLIQKLINNIHFLKRQVDKKADTGADGKVPVNQLPVDEALSATSQNPVQNKIVQAAIKALNDAITAINTALSGKAASNHNHSAATTGAAGFMSAADKTKLDGIAAKATANTASTTTPKALGTASAGSEAGFARGDHVHPKPSAADIGAAAASHNHSAANITSGILAVARGGTGNDSGYVRAGQKAGTTIGDNATAEGSFATASGAHSHAEGRYTVASDFATHAEGAYTKATGGRSHAEGSETIASGNYSHAEGLGSIASGERSHAEGSGKAEGSYSHAGGVSSVASAEGAFATGYAATASNYASCAIGKLNKAMADGGAYNTKTGDAFVIGNGSSSVVLGNAFRVTYAGQVYGLSAFNTSGADYA